jgi:hypothetical protein
MQIQIELDEESNKIVELYRVIKGIKSKKLAIVEIIKEHISLLDKIK